MKRILTKRMAAAAALTLITFSLLPQPAEARGDRGWFYRFFRPQGNIVDRLEKSGQFNILLTAVETAGLTGTLETAELTLFAPTDQAFAELLDELGISAEDLLNNPELSNILLYHALGGKKGIGQLLFGGYPITLYNDQPVIVTYNRGGVMVNQARVIRPNLWANNGYIHVIDAVLLPPEEEVAVESSLDVLRLDGRFTILLTALERAGLEDAVKENELTIFAPTDEAFADLLAELDISAGDLLASPDLTDILLYHVVGGSQRAFKLLIEGEATTLQGDDVYVSFGGGKIRVNDSEVINPNLKSPTGIIHTIDKVLLP
jgi:uncharacterized surface protein with fasciclin (FAS1) repeats